LCLAAVCITFKVIYAATGSAVPEGDTAYVLTPENNDYWLWNAQTGEHFSYSDNYCPVHSVGCLINDENVHFTNYLL